MNDQFVTLSDELKGISPLHGVRTRYPEPTQVSHVLSINTPSTIHVDNIIHQRRGMSLPRWRDKTDAMKLCPRA